MNGKSTRDELLEIFSALHIHSLSAFSLGSDLPIVVGAQQGYRAPDGDAKAGLLGSLRDTLYGSRYTRSASQDGAAPQSLLPALAQANQSRDRWDAGWSIYHVGADGRVGVQKGESSRVAVPGEYATNKAPGMLPQMGDAANLRVLPGSAAVQQGYYHAFGETPADQFDNFALVRFYFNIRAEGAAELLRAVSGRFNHYSIPYSFKTPADAAGYNRADAAVLYVSKRYCHIAASLLHALSAALEPWLRPETPMFCKTLRPGIGFAEEPGTGESFGMHRCRLVAEGIVDTWVLGSQAADARLDAVHKRFSVAGISLDSPYLNARSIDLFDTATLPEDIAL